jgi:outer membrane protein assembly factor BamA
MLDAHEHPLVFLRKTGKGGSRNQMPNAILIAFVSVLSLGSVAAPATAKQEQGVPPPFLSSPEDTGAANNTVKSIDFVGNQHYKAKVLGQRLDFKKGSRLDPVLTEAGRRIIEEIYRKVGFAFVKVALDRAKLPTGQVLYAIDEGPRVRIASVKFSGNKAIKTDTLRKITKIKQKSWFYWPFYYTKEAVAEDVVRLENFYYEKGFLDYKITAETQFSDDKSGVYLTFVIEEGPAYRIENILFAGNKYFDDDTLRARLELTPGEVYIKRKAAADAQRLLKLYGEHGFVDADIQHKPRFCPEVGADVVNVEFNIVEGNQFRIGQVEITGDEVTQDKVVRHVLDEYGFTPGQLYNGDIAPKQGGGILEKYVQRMALAEEVMIRPVTPASGAPDQKDAKVDIKEGTTGWINPGVGVSSDYGMIGQLIYEQRNFDITDWPESFGEFITMKAFRGAGQRMRIAFQPGTELSVYSINFSDPYWQGRPVTLDVAGSSFERYRESYREGRLRSYLGFEQRFQDRWRRSIGLRAENVDVRSLEFDAPQEIIDVKGDNLLVGVKFGIGRSVIDDIYDPTTGHVFDADYEQVTGDHTFGVLEGSYVWYNTLYQDVLERKTVLAVKVRAGTTVIDDAPPFEKFYAGGTGTYGIRGFEYRGISPRGLQTNVPVPQRKDPIGSDWIFLAGTEVTVPLIGENFDALFFFDSGTVQTGRYRMSLGTGIQIRIPHWFGPVPMRFEVAAPLKKDEDDETQVFSFSIGRLF